MSDLIEEEIETCENCDEPVGETGLYTADDVLLCKGCYDDLGADPLNHADECDCEDCAGYKLATPESVGPNA